MGKAVLLVVGVVLLVYAVFDLLATPPAQVKQLPKAIWFLIILVPFVGPLLWVFLGHAKQVPPTPPRGTGGWTPPPGPRGPDDDPDYLRGL
jgi:hypothetical protein